ncbi:unnamed protein product [Heligmosomoides polygyrus]|uniref:BRCT domain-containing protein n=1 Tax=Heligmosomoides polygyrus TaxID=6339 RepID=A0A3P7Z008_HELPZ|nr:unnamed protein product [Heligmosomoides polygyrus]
MSSNSLLSGNEPIDATRPSEPQEKIRGSVAAQRQHLTAKSKDSSSRDLARVPLGPAAARKELQQADHEMAQRAPAGGAPKTAEVFRSVPQRLERVPSGGLDQTGSRSAPEQLVLDQVSTTTTGRTGSGNPAPAPSAVQISVKKERVSVVLSDTVRRFVFTSVLPQERLRLSNIISRLGGIADPGELNDDVTHLICGKLIRGAKLMGCIASGRWVLGSDYVDKSLEAGKWLPEADFELGNPSKLASRSFSEREQKLAEACRRWRLKLEGRGASKRSGAFHGWRCVLYCSEEKAAGLVPMLQAGGVDAVTMRQGDEGAPHTFRPTHAVVCSSAMWNGEELEMLVDVGAKVFQLEYISKFLLEENVDEAACYHVEYKKFLQCRR